MNDGDDDEDVAPGEHYIYVARYGSNRIRAIADFTVIGGGEIIIDPEEGPVGTEVEIEGTEFGDSEDFTVEYDGDEIDIESGDSDTDSNGEFILTVIIPESTAGEHTIKVLGEDSGAEPQETFTVEPEITVSPTEANAN